MDCLIDNIVGDIRYFSKKLLDKKQGLTCDDIRVFRLHNEMFNSCFCRVCWFDEQNNNIRTKFDGKFKEYHEITKTSRSNVEDYYNKNKNNFDAKKATEYIKLVNLCIEEIETFKCQYGDTKLINDKERLVQNIDIITTIIR